ncbi:MAG: alpha/beta hydrolase [Spongiibacter sp.]|nr:alpha/beta hydrolase [Spongiibacter sp.]
MDPNKIHPDLRDAVAKFPPLPLRNRFMLYLMSIASPLMGKAMTVPGVKITTRRASGVKVRVYQPENNGNASGAGLLWIHGGGLVIGSPKLNDRECTDYVKKYGMSVVSVDYRLAPRHRYPAAIDDCFTVWNWFQENASTLNVNPERIIIAGQSAGGGLTAALAQRVHDQGKTPPLAQLLYYPMLDDRTATRRELDAIKHPIWNNSLNQVGWSAYLGDDFGGPAVPSYGAPARREDLTGLPPTWIGVGGIDLFLEENIEYAERLKSAGVQCQLDVVDMAPHGFDALFADTSLRREFIAKIDEFVARILSESK